jgi:cytochrome c-type biogenesis protein
MQELFSALTTAVEGAPAVALAAAFVWGILSIVLSPCHLASIPLIVGYIDGQGRVSTGRAFVLSTLFAVGILVTIALIGVLTAAAGRLMGDLGAVANYAVAGIFFIVGLYLLDVIQVNLAGPVRLGIVGRGLIGAALLGLVFGVALGPCTFAYMAPILGVTFKAGSAQPVFAGMLLLLYGVGHCSVIVAAGSASGLVQHYLNWNERSGSVIWLRRACGVLVLLGGLWLIYTAPAG